jgi:hypothetical protein
MQVSFHVRPSVRPTLTRYSQNSHILCHTHTTHHTHTHTTHTPHTHTHHTPHTHHTHTHHTPHTHHTHTHKHHTHTPHTHTHTQTPHTHTTHTHILVSQLVKEFCLIQFRKRHLTGNMWYKCSEDAGVYRHAVRYGLLWSVWCYAENGSLEPTVCSVN